MSKRRIHEGGFRKNDYKDNGYFYDDSAKKHLTKICDYIYKIESRLGDTHTPYYECVGKIMDILSEYGINPSWTVNESITRHKNKQLYNIIKESVKKVLKEWESDEQPESINIDGKYSFGNLNVIIKGCAWGTPVIEYKANNRYGTTEHGTSQGSKSEKFMMIFNDIYQKTQNKEESIYQTAIQVFNIKL